MRLINFFIIIVLFVACQSKAKESAVVADTKVEVEIPTDFLSFYDRFHSDSLFQLEHVIFPLHSIKDDKRYTRENWKLHTPFDSQGGTFYRSFNNINGIIVEFITEDTGFVTIERRFSKMGGEYQLIYYDIESQFGKSESN